MDTILDALNYMAVWWYRTAYGANTELLCMAVAPLLMQ